MKRTQEDNIKRIKVRKSKMVNSRSTSHKKETGKIDGKRQEKKGDRDGKKNAEHKRRVEEKE